MATLQEHATGQSEQTDPAQSSRIYSLDAFRGLVILTMVFVNYLAGVSHIPAWAKHTPDKVDGYTIVDLVFPGFLFIVGVAIPFAFHKRMERGESMIGLLGRIIARSASLIFMGFVMVNEETFSAKETGMSYSWWFLFANLGIVAIWCGLPDASNPGRKKVVLGIKAIGVLVMIFLLIVFRGKHGWMEHSWWGILGLIGWAYLNCSVLYLIFRGSSVALMGMLGFMIALYIGGKHGVLDWLGPVNDFISVGENFGTTSGSVMIGVLVGNCFLSGAAAQTQSQRVRFMLLFGIGLYLAGTLMRPLHGVIKNAATDSYTLVAGGLCCLAFLLVYLVMDVWKFRGWAAAFIPVGQSALLAYVLPGIMEYIFDILNIGGWVQPYSSGLPGAINCAVLTIVVLAITWAAHKAGLRLKA